MNAPTVNISSVIEVLNAAHLTYAVQSPFPQRSGIMLVCPPGHLKTSVLDTLSDNFPNFLLLSDLNQPGLTMMKDELFAGKFKSIGFKDMIKLYERNPAVAANLEGTLRSMVEEGWSGAAIQNPAMAKQSIRMMILGCMTPKIYESKFNHWKDTGFSRRFLWCHYALRIPSLIGDAIEEQRMIPISCDPIRIPQNGSLSTAMLDPAESKEIRSWLKQQPGQDGSPFNLLLKIAVVLKWHYKRKPEQNFMVVLRNFSKTLQNEYVLVDVPDDHEPGKEKNGKTQRDAPASLSRVQKNRARSAHA